MPKPHMHPQQPTQQQVQYAPPIRSIPINELDMNMQLTDPVYGTAKISTGLKDKLKKYYRTTEPNGDTTVSYEDLWDLLGFYTRDLRLANLSTMNGEFQYCQYHLDLAGDFLQSEMIRPFLICISRAATVMELSQSKNGFFRRLLNTFIHKEQKTTIEPPRRKLFGGNQRNEDMGG